MKVISHVTVDCKVFQPYNLQLHEGKFLQINKQIVCLFTKISLNGSIHSVLFKTDYTSRLGHLFYHTIVILLQNKQRFTKILVDLY